MATQTIGLEAVFDISKFTSSANSYKQLLNGLNTSTTATATSITQSGTAFRQAAAAVNVYTAALTRLANVASTIPPSMRSATEAVKKNSKTMKKAGRTTQEYRRELGGLSETSRDTTKGLQQAGSGITAATQATSKGLKQAGSAINDYKQQIESLGQTSIRSKVSIEQTGTSLSSIGAIAGGAAVAGVAALTAAVGALGVGLAASVGEAANFQQGIADIAAVTGNSIEAVGELKDLALDLSLDPQLSVTATEAAGALEVLAKNGITAEAILSGVGRSTVEIANATGEDFALAADVATDALKLFGIEADEFSKVGDNITGVLVNSKFGLNDVRLALAQGGAVAASAGIEFDEFAAVIAATSSNFASGSDAGTAFKTFLQRLQSPTGAAKKQLEQLGISLFDTEGKARDITEVFNEFARLGAEGAVVSEGFVIGGRTEEQEAELQRLQRTLAKTQQELRDYDSGLAGVRQSEAKKAQVTDQLNREQAILIKEIAELEKIQSKTVNTSRKLTEQETQQALTTIFGADAIRFATGAMELQEGAVADLTEKISQEGLAQQAAATRTETFQGAIDRLKSAYEFLKITVGTPFLSPLTAFFDDTVTPGIRLLGSLADGINDIQTGGNKLAGLAIDLGFGAETVGDINEISAAFAENYEAGIELAKSKAIAATEEFLTDIFGNIDFTELGAQLSGIAFDFGFSVDTANQIYAIGQAFDEGLLPGLQSISDFVGGIDVSGGGLLAALGFSEETITLAQSFATQITDLFGLFTSFDLEGLGEFDFGSLFTGFLETFGSFREDIITGAGVALGGLVEALQEFGQSEEALSAVDNITSGIAFVIVEGLTASLSDLPGLVTAFAGLAENLIKAGATLFLTAAVIGGQLFAKILAGFAEKITGEELKVLGITELGNLLKDIGAFVTEQAPIVGKSIVDGITDGIKNNAEFAYKAILGFGEGFVNAFKEFLGISSPSTLFADFGLNIVEGLVKGLVDNAGMIITTLQGLIPTELPDLPDFELPGFLGGGEEGQGEAGGIFEFAKGIKDNLGSALEETGDIVSATVAPAFEDVSAVTGLFNTEAQEGANIANGQLSPALSRVGSIAQTNTTPSLRAASDAIQQNTNQAQKLASILNGQLNSASETFAELWARIGSNAEDAIEPLTEVKNLLGEIASFLQAIQAAGGGSAGQAAQASGGASTAGATAAGAFQSFSSVRNTNTNNTFNLTVNSSQSSRGVIGDFGRLQALV